MASTSLDQPTDEPVRGHEFAEALRRHWGNLGTGGRPIVFRTEHGDYVPLEIVDTDGATVVMLLESGK